MERSIKGQVIFACVGRDVTYVMVMMMMMMLSLVDIGKNLGRYIVGK